MIAKNPDSVRNIDQDLMGFFLRKSTHTDRDDDRQISLARIGYGADSDFGYGVAENAINILVKRGDTASAAQFLPNLKDPVQLENMLIQKRYAVLWPKIESVAGPHFEKVQQASVEAAEKAYSQASDDHDALQAYANALRHAHRFNEAIALQSKLPASADDLAKADEKLGWAFNNVALAMHSAGQLKAADALFARLNEAQIVDPSWRISMKINRLELLVGDGRFDEAMALMPDTEATAQTDGSPYARQLVRRLKYCSLSKLGRKDEAAKLRPELMAHAQDAAAPTIDGLLCAGEDAAAEQLALASLKNDSFVEDFVRSLQKRPLTDDDPSVWQGQWQQFRSRPAIAAAFDRLGRDLPDADMPLTH